MGKPLRVLVVEDVEQDALLVVRELKRGGFDVTFERVETRETMLDALVKQRWDIVISDYRMPRFSAPMALSLVKEHKLDLPFIIVSGTVGEEVAVEAMREGAHDFMPKGRLGRLIPAVERELRDVALRAERSKLQEQLLISDRMASVGVLAAGVAHEINNPLAALMANLEFAAEGIAELTQELRSPDSVRRPTQADEASGASVGAGFQKIAQPLQDARECAIRVRNIVRDLKLFSRPDEMHNGAVDVRRVIESSLRIAGNEIRHRARLVEQYGEVPPVQGNEGRLGQVFLNLIVNAIQAVPEGQADSNEIRIVTKQDDPGAVIVEVWDTGSGIPESVIARIFDPFFTTKPVGVGTGLGLSICHRIVVALGGRLLVESHVGKGSVFRIVLPQAVDHAVEPSPPPAAAVVAGRRGKILVVDDEVVLGAAVRRMLGADHEVLALTRAQEAIDRIRDGERFDLILCDLIMPEVTGMELHAELLRLAPEQAQAIVFMSGGAFTVRAREFLDQVGNPCIDKPFDAEELRTLVQR